MIDAKPYRAFAAIPPLEYPQAWAPLEYSGWKDEQLSWKQTCYIGDWSFVTQIRIVGPDALKLFQYLSVNSFERFPIGQAKHSIMCDEEGKVIAEGVLIRHGEEDFEFEASTTQWVFYNLKKGNYNAEATFRGSHKFQVSGPTSLALLEKLTKSTLRDVKFMNFKVVPIDGRDVMFLRQGMAGEVGFELHGPIEQHNEVYSAVLEAGREFGIRRLGRRTIQINHLEACYPTTGIHYWNALSGARYADYRQFMDKNLPREWYGGPFAGPLKYNFPTSFTGSWDGASIEELFRSPVEMGWTKNIKFDHDFIGREALAKEVENPKRTVVTIEFNNDDMLKVYASHFGDGDVYHLFEMPHAPYVA